MKLIYNFIHFIKVKYEKKIYAKYKEERKNQRLVVKDLMRLIGFQ